MDLLIFVNKVVVRRYSGISNENDDALFVNRKHYGGEFIR